MATFKFNVNIEAKDNEEAKSTLKAMFEIKKLFNNEELIKIGNNIGNKNSLIKTMIRNKILSQLG